MADGNGQLPRDARHDGGRPREAAMGASLVRREPTLMVTMDSVSGAV